MKVITESALPMGLMAAEQSVEVEEEEEAADR